MTGRTIEDPVAFESPKEQRQSLGELSKNTFDWVDYQCPCPNCGTQVTDFRTRDLCNLLDTVDYRTTKHFYAMCTCGTCIDFIRKTATGIEDFDRRVEQL